MENVFTVRTQTLESSAQSESYRSRIYLFTKHTYMHKCNHSEVLKIVNLLERVGGGNGLNLSFLPGSVFPICQDNLALQPLPGSSF